MQNKLCIYTFSWKLERPCHWQSRWKITRYSNCTWSGLQTIMRLISQDPRVRVLIASILSPNFITMSTSRSCDPTSLSLTDSRGFVCVGSIRNYCTVGFTLRKPELQWDYARAEDILRRQTSSTKFCAVALLSCLRTNPQLKRELARTRPNGQLIVIHTVQAGGEK